MSRRGMTHQEYMDCPLWALELVRAYDSKGGDTYGEQ